MTPTRLLTTLFVALSAWGSARPAHAVNPTPTFAQLVKAGQLPYRGELVINGRTVLRVSHGGPGRQRQEVLAPPDMAGELVIDNGHTRWHYSPRTGRVDIAPSSYGLRRSDQNERLLERNFQLRVIRLEAVAGRPATVVELRPRYQARMSQRLWLDTATGIPLRVQRINPQGAVIETNEFRHLVAPTAVAPSDFEFALPARAKVTSSVQMVAMGRSLADLKVPLPFGVRMPGYLPPGFEVMYVQLFETHGVRSIHWRLSDGLDTLSLFQTSRDHEAQRPEGAQDMALPNATGYMVGHGWHHMLCWDSSAGSFSLVGDLSPEELKRVAASTKP